MDGIIFNDRSPEPYDPCSMDSPTGNDERASDPIGVLSEVSDGSTTQHKDSMLEREHANAQLDFTKGNTSSTIVLIIVSNGLGPWTSR